MKESYSSGLSLRCQHSKLVRPCAPLPPPVGNVITTVVVFERFCFFPFALVSVPFSCFVAVVIELKINVITLPGRDD